MTPEPVIHAVDDDLPFLNALERCLRATGRAVRTYSRADEFMATFEPELPGCVITDLRMPGIDGLGLQHWLCERPTPIPVIFVTGHGDATTAVAALKNGAVDFLQKPFSHAQLLTSIDDALARNARDREIARERDLVQARFDSLTPREREVFALVVSDRPNKEIARQLKISCRTVEHHREHLMLKMHARSLAELITMAVICGIHDLHLHLHRAARS